MTWTPPSLAHLTEPPSFDFRPIERGQVALRHALAAAGVCFHGAAAIRDEAERAIRALVEPEFIDATMGRLRALWARIDGGEELEADEQAALDDLEARLNARWTRLRTMAADDAAFASEAPRIAASLVLAGWSNLEVPFDLAAGRIPLATIDAIEAALMAIEQGHDLALGTAFAALGAHSLIIISGTTPTERTET